MDLRECEDKRGNGNPSQKRCDSGRSNKDLGLMAVGRTVSRTTNMERLAFCIVWLMAIGLVLVPIAAYPTDAADCASRSFPHPSYSAPVLCTTVCNAKKNSSDQREFCSRNCPGFYQDCVGEPKQTPLSQLQPSITPSAANNNNDLVHPAIQPLPSEVSADVKQSAIYDGTDGIATSQDGVLSLAYIVLLAVFAAPCILGIIVVIVVVLRRRCIKQHERKQKPQQETGLPDPSAVRLMRPEMTPLHRLPE